jgi:2-amino-4-hydroxy-6-hydroxymethyldihydropteridine pyrophosphokinase
VKSGTEIRQALVAAGSNLGDRATTLTRALESLRAAEGILVVEPSPLYETEPVGMVDQPRFLNLVAGIETTLIPEALLETLQRIEQRFGRERIVRWGPRTLDLDLLAFEGATRDDARLQLPHPRMRERAFVLVPLTDVLARPSFAHRGWDTLRAHACATPRIGVSRFQAPPPSPSPQS